MPAVLPYIAVGLAAVGTGASIYQGIDASNSQRAAQMQVQADQQRQIKAADARQPNTSAIMASAMAKGGSSSGTNITGGVAGAPPLGGGGALLGNG
jgi:hypothetical protein